MNHVLLFNEDFQQHNVILHDYRLNHIRDQLKAVPGDTVKLGLWHGKLGHGTVLSIDADRVVLAPQLEQLPPAASPVKLILAMPRPKVLRRVLRSIVELGVKEIHLINSWRVDKSYWQTPLLESQNLTKTIIDGLCIAKDTVPPTLVLHQRFKPFVEDKLPNLCGGQPCFVAHPSRTPCPTNITEPCWLAIGPEGGFIDYEINLLADKGFVCVSLGKRILRVESAVCAAIGRLNTI